MRIPAHKEEAPRPRGMARARNTLDRIGHNRGRPLREGSGRRCRLAE
jgi:hypothetical protein